MKRLFTLMLAAFVFAFTAPLIVRNASAADEAATSATDNAVQGDNAGAKEEMHHHHGHSAAANEANKTNGTKHTHARHHHKHKHHKKAEGTGEKGADEGAETGK